jgi:hypothetical protein
LEVLNEVNLLDEYNEIECIELLKSLPLKRKIVHEVNLILGASVPSQSMYMMCLIESVDLN